MYQNSTYLTYLFLFDKLRRKEQAGNEKREIKDKVYVLKQCLNYRPH